MSTPPPFQPNPSGPSSSAPPPKKRLSGCAIAAIVAGGLFVVMIPIVAILAAIAIPQYQEYVIRTRIVQAHVAAQDLQRTIDRYRSEHGQCPDAQALGMTNPAMVKLSPTKPSAATFVLDTPTSDGAAGCGFEMGFSQLSPLADGKTIHYVSDGSGWQCRDGTLDARMRPPPCR